MFLVYFKKREKSTIQPVKFLWWMSLLLPTTIVRYFKAILTNFCMRGELTVELGNLLMALVVIVIVGAVAYLIIVKFIKDAAIQGVVLLVVGLLLLLYFLDAVGFINIL
jgi:uncharacterized membrane protein